MKTRKLSDAYNTTALLFFNIFVLFLVLNFFFFAFYKVKDHFFKANPIIKKYGLSFLKHIYPQYNEEELHHLLNEVWSIHQDYEAFTQFKESVSKGTYVNVDENGFRMTKNQGPWPPNINDFTIFLFGGSTTFCYGLPDDQTTASFLQIFLSEKAKTSIRVYNFGRGFYYSTQERILFEKLLLAGFIPDMAIFIDGLNDFYFHDDRPANTNRLERYMKKPRVQQMMIDKMPLTRALREVRDYIKNSLVRNKVREKKTASNVAIYNDKKLIQKVISRYFKNKKMVEATAGVYGVKTFFVWQPVPLYKYDLKYHLFAHGDFGAHTYTKYGYIFLAEQLHDINPGDNFLWCADIHEDLREPLYVDKLHYGAKLTKMLAGVIAGRLLEQGVMTNR